MHSSTFFILTVSLTSIASAAPTLNARNNAQSPASALSFALRSKAYGTQRFNRRALPANANDNPFYWLDVQDAMPNNTLTPKSSYNRTVGLGVAPATYFVEMSIGTPPQQYATQIDTGSMYLWAFGDTCNNCKSNTDPDKQARVGYSSSSTFKLLSNETHAMAYGSGKAKAYLASDVVTLGNMTLGAVDLQAVTQQESFDGTEFISLMGISNYKNVSDPLYSTTGAAMLDRLKSQGTIPTRSVGIALGRPADGTQGSLTFGGVDRNALKGDLIPASNVSIDHLYRVNITGVKVGESAIAVNDSLHNAVLDTGSTVLYLPTDVIDAIGSQITGFHFDPKKGYLLPCNTSSVVQFTIGGTDWPISTKDFIWRRADPTGPNPNDMCVSAMFPQVQGYTLIGDTFLKNVYMYVDLDADTIALGRSSLTA